MKNPPLFSADAKLEACIQCMFGISSAAAYRESFLSKEELASLPMKPLRNPDEESVFDFRHRQDRWREDIDRRVKIAMASYMTERLKGLIL